jgi:hypothetical protein
MDERDGRGRLRTFLLGGLVGASAVIAAARRRQQAPAPRTVRGLDAFEDAPCYRELAEEEPRRR